MRPREEFDGGGFAGAVGAEEGDDFAGAEVRERLSRARTRWRSAW